MIQNRNLLIALILLGLVSTVLLLQAPDQSSGNGEEKALPELQLTEVDGINLVSNTARISLRQSETGWIVEERFGYAASFESLSELLNQLQAMTIAERKTAKPENHARLGVADDGIGAGIKVELFPQNASLILGSRSPSQGSYFRYLDDPQVYLSRDPVEIEMDLLHWLDPVIVNVDPESIREVTISTEDANFLSASWDDEAQSLRLNNLPESRELRYEGIADTLGRLLINLRFQDVEPYQDGFFIDPSILNVTLADGSVLTLKSVMSGEDFWLHLAAEDKENWQYRISSSTYADLNKTTEDMLKPIEEGS